MTTMNEARFDQESARPTELAAAWERLREEHGELLRMVEELERLAQRLKQQTDPEERLSDLLYVRLWTIALMEELERHSAWEDSELYPFLYTYFDRKKQPTLGPSIWQLEKEHELAEQYLNGFLRTVHGAKGRLDQAFSSRAAAYVMHACFILKGHLAKEEELIHPMLDQVLTDIDYLFA